MFQYFLKFENINCLRLVVIYWAVKKCLCVCVHVWCMCVSVSEHVSLCLCVYACIYVEVTIKISFIPKSQAILS